MNKRFSTELKEKKLRKAYNWLGLALFVALIYYLTQFPFGDFSNLGWGALMDNGLLLLLIGFWAYSYRRQMKKVVGAYVQIEDEGLSFKSLGIEKSFRSMDLIENIDVKLSTIEIYDLNNNMYSIHLNVYDYKDRLQIKEAFTQIKGER